MFNILHLSSSDIGGAGSAAYRFHKNLQKNGCNSKFLVARKTKDDSSVIEVPPKPIKRFFYRCLNKFELVFKLFDSKYYFFEKNRNDAFDFNNLDLGFAPDVIVLHWVTGFADYDFISRMKKKYKSKVYWYFMDMAPMTGGCHYSWSCDGYKKDCLECPAVPTFKKKLPAQTIIKKSEFVKNCEVKALSPSVQLTRQIKDSKIFTGNNFFELMLGIDEDVFSPEINILFSEPLNNISKNKRNMLIAANSLCEERKGIKHIINAIKIVKANNPEIIKSLNLLVMGNLKYKYFFENLGFSVSFIGQVSSERKLAAVYQVTDFFISASIEDSGPMMINESIISGTPVVSYKMGVAEDLIITGKTGYLAQLEDIEDLARGILFMSQLSSYRLSELKENCRILGVEKTSDRTQINTFLNIIKG